MTSSLSWKPEGRLRQKWAPRWLTTYEGNSGKNGAMKGIFTPRWIENPKGRFRQKWGLKIKNEKMKYIKALTTDANIQCLPSTDTPSNGDLYPRTFQGSSSTSFIALSHGFDTSLNDGLSKEVFPCKYVAARATTCPTFQCFVCLCEISLSSFKPIMHFKHSYMHSHAFYVLIHPIILLCHTYMLHFQFQFSI